MADTKITALTADTSPTSDDLIPTVTDPAGTPANRKVTLANAITKAHGLSDGIVKVASGTMAVATASTDYAPATSGTGVLKGNGTGGFSTATANTDYYAPKAKLDATTAPGSSNDNTQGYAIGSVWVDVTGDKSYIAVDVSTGAAVWNDLTASAGGGINNVVEDLTPQLGGDLDMNTHNITAGATTISPTELGYLDGVTSAIQGQIDGKQAADADLTTLSTAFTSASASGPASLALHEDTDNGTNKITITGQSALAGDQVITLPDATGTVALTSDLSAYQPAGATLASLEGLTLNAGDMLYATAADTLADLALGSPNQELRVNAGGTAPEWYTPSASGGQTLVNHIVAASGGTHTTLGAAVTAASSGDTIWVMSGTYVESAITSTTTNLTIIGENPETAIISMGANNLTLSGVGITVLNLGITSTTGDLTFSGASSRLQNCVISHASGASGFTQSGNYGMSRDNRFTSTSAASAGQFVFSGTENSCIGNRFSLSNSSGATTDGAIQLTSTSGIFANNIIFGGTASNDNHADIALNSANFVFSGNYMDVTADPHKCVYVGVAGSSSTIVGNVFEGGAGRVIDMAAGDSVFTGNVVKLGNDSAVNYGIYNTATNNTITSNKIYCMGTTNTGGIYQNNDYGLIQGNAIYRGVIGIELHANSEYNLVTGNYLMDSATSISDGGTGNTCLANKSTVDSMINTTKEFHVMKNTSGGALSAGQLVVWKAVAAGNEITTTTTAGDDKVFGVMIDAPANNAFGRVQTLGKNVLLKVDGTTDIAIGDPITTFTTAGIGAKATTGDMIIGYALEAYTANDSLGVIDVLLVTPRLI